MIDKPIFDFNGKPGIPLNTPDKSTLGIYLANGPSKKVIGEEEACNLLTTLNFTGPPGTASVLYYSLMFMLSSGGWQVAKIDEWIEVAAKDTEFFQKMQATKQGLEARVKEGITQAAASVADYELVQHDLRKYKQFVKYFHDDDEYSLRALFIDKIDIHTDIQGYPTAIRSIVSRWPTIIADFQKLDDDDLTPKEIMKKLKISEAEAVILATKNKLYVNWKRDFKNTVVQRYETLVGLARSKERSLHEYRTWLKPYITRYKMTRLGSESKQGRAAVFKSFADISASSTFTNGIQVWAWTPLKPADVKNREIEKTDSKFIIHPYDPWTREHFILDDKKGLANIYPWLKNEKKYCINCKKYLKKNEDKCNCGEKTEKRYVADQIIEEEIIPAWERKEDNLNPTESYYSFLVFDVFRAGSKLPIGEIEDITFSIYSYAISHNVLLVKLLELKCREREFEMYIDEILGLRLGVENIDEMLKQDFPKIYGEKPKELSEMEKLGMDLQKISNSFTKYFKKSNKARKAPGKFMFVKPGPYETDFFDRITKFYLAVNGKHFGSVTGFLKSKMGVG